jgi:hypothetical protein
MHPFATHLITFLIGGIVAVLYANYHVERRETAAHNRGYFLGAEAAQRMQAEKDSERAKKAAQTRRSKANAS